MPITQSPEWYSSGAESKDGPGPDPGPSPSPDAAETSVIFTDIGRGENQALGGSNFSGPVFPNYNDAQAIFFPTLRGPSNGAPDTGITPTSSDTVQAVYSFSTTTAPGELEADMIYSQFSWACPGGNAQELTLLGSTLYGYQPGIFGSFKSTANNKRYDYGYFNDMSEDVPEGKVRKDICLFTELDPDEEPQVYNMAFGYYTTEGWYSFRAWGFTPNGTGYTLTSWIQSIQVEAGAPNKIITYWSGDASATGNKAVFASPAPGSTTMYTLFNCGDNKWQVMACNNRSNSVQQIGSVCQWRPDEDIPVENIFGWQSSDTPIYFNGAYNFTPIIWADPANNNRLTLDRLAVNQSTGYGDSFTLTPNSYYVTGLPWDSIEYDACSSLTGRQSSLAITDYTNNAVYVCVLNSNLDGFTGVFKITHPTKALNASFISYGNYTSVMTLSDQDVLRVPLAGFYETSFAGYVVEDVSTDFGMSFQSTPVMVGVGAGINFTETDTTFPDGDAVSDRPTKGNDPDIRGTQSRVLPEDGENQGNAVAGATIAGVPVSLGTDNLTWYYTGGASTDFGANIWVQSASTAPESLDGVARPPLNRFWQFPVTAGMSSSMNMKINYGLIPKDGWAYLSALIPNGGTTYGTDVVPGVVRFNAAGDCELVTAFSSNQYPSGGGGWQCSYPVPCADGESFYFQYQEAGNISEYNYPTVKVGYDGSIKWISGMQFNQNTYRERPAAITRDAEDNVYSFMTGGRDNDPSTRARVWVTSWDKDGNFRYMKRLYDVENPTSSNNSVAIWDAFSIADYVYFYASQQNTRFGLQLMRFTKDTGELDLDWQYIVDFPINFVPSIANVVSETEFIICGQGGQNVNMQARVDIGPTVPQVVWATAIKAGPQYLNSSLQDPSYFTDGFFPSRGNSGWNNVRTDGAMRTGIINTDGAWPNWQSWPITCNLIKTSAPNWSSVTSDDGTLINLTAVDLTSAVGPLEEYEPTPWSVNYTPWQF